MENMKWNEVNGLLWGMDAMETIVSKSFQAFGSDFASAYFLFVADHPLMKQIGLLERHHSLVVICPSSWNLQKTNTSSAMECKIIKGREVINLSSYDIYTQN